MAYLSIRNMNHTMSERELSSTYTLTKLERLSGSFEVAQSMQKQDGFPHVQLKGANREAELLHELIEYVNTDPAHINKATRQSFEEFVNSPDEVAYREKRAAEWKAWKAQHPNASPYHFSDVGKFGL